MIRNYRVCFRPKDPVPTHQIHEVFYDNHYDVIGYEKNLRLRSETSQKNCMKVSVI